MQRQFLQRGRVPDWFREQQCEAWYYVGLKRLMNGDRAGGADAFQKSIATGEKSRSEYDFAKAELKSLGK